METWFPLGRNLLVETWFPVGNRVSKKINYMSNSKQYDLEERTAKFGEDIVKFAKKIPENSVTKRIIPQLVASGTSIGANYCEANNASSKSDFRNKIYICKKETNETKYWLRILTKADSNLKNEAQKLWQEAQEFNLIFQKIVNTLNKKK